ncbi:enoyl-CoA hydratase/isomerase family protein [soil metagenome]
MTDYAEAGLLVTREGPVLSVTLDRPESRNAQTPALWRALADVGLTIDPEVRIVVLRGAGASFSAGLDRRMLTPEGIAGELTFGEMTAGSEADFDATINTYQAGFTWLRNPQFVSIAVVQGHAIGAGFQLALACDMRMATEDVSFNMKETALGMVPDLGGTKVLVEAIGYARALEVCALSRNIHAEEALAWGLVNLVVDSDGLDSAVDHLVQGLLAPDAGAVRALKALLQGASELAYDDQRAAERTSQRGRFKALAAYFLK